MKVKDFIIYLQDQPQEAEILIDGRNIEDFLIYTRKDWNTTDDTPSVIVHIES